MCFLDDFFCSLLNQMSRIQFSVRQLSSACWHRHTIQDIDIKISNSWIKYFIIFVLSFNNNNLLYHGNFHMWNLKTIQSCQPLNKLTGAKFKFGVQSGTTHTRTHSRKLQDNRISGLIIVLKMCWDIKFSTNFFNNCVKDTKSFKISS